MKILSAASFLFSLIVFNRIAVRMLSTAERASLATMLVAFTAPPMLETVNGMEMNLYMLLVLCLVDVLTDERLSKHRNLLIWALSVALILTRFESPFLITFLLMGILASRERSSLVHLGASAGTAFLFVELWRFVEFRSWMPNTAYAKMLVPYSPPHLLLPMLMNRMAAESEIIHVLGGPIFLILLTAIASPLFRGTSGAPRWLGTHRFVLSGVFFGFAVVSYRRLFPKLLPSVWFPGHDLLILATVGFLALAIAAKACILERSSRTEKSVAVLAAAGVLFGIFFGKNWGYEGRMILPCIPFLILSIALFLERNIRSEHWRTTALASCVLLQILAWGRQAEESWIKGDAVPVSMIERNGLAADAVRRAAGLNSVSILIPDVGGSALCCERLEILDSALLTNPYLAHHGYAAFENYLHSQRPQIIESHGYWSVISMLYKSDVIRDYRLSLVGQTRLLLRSDVYDAVYQHSASTTGIHMISGPACLGNVEAWEPDQAFVRSRKTCLYISGDSLGQHQTNDFPLESKR